MSDLKPCPFCGGEPLIGDCMDAFWAWCPTCDVTHETESAAINAWNTRAESAAISAAVQEERKAIKAHIDSEAFMPSKEYDRASHRIDAWESGVCDVVEYLDSRGPAPAVVCPECDGERWHEYENPLTGEITNRTPCATCNGAEGVPGPAPAVDALGIVREYVEAHAGLDNEFEIHSEESIAAETRFESAFAALRALVDGGLQS